MTHTCVIDEYGLCFECDKPARKRKLAAARQAKKTTSRKALGLVRLQEWVTPEQRDLMMSALNASQADVDSRLTEFETVLLAASKEPLQKIQLKRVGTTYFYPNIETARRCFFTAKGWQI